MKSPRESEAENGMQQNMNQTSAASRSALARAIANRGPAEPHGLDRHIMAAVGRASARRRRRQLWLTWLAAAAGIVVLAVALDFYCGDIMASAFSGWHLKVSLTPARADAASFAGWHYFAGILVPPAVVLLVADSILRRRLKYSSETDILTKK